MGIHQCAQTSDNIWEQLMLLCRQNVSEKAYFRLYLSLDLMFYLTGKQCKGETSVPLIKFCVNATVCLFFNLVFF